MFQSAPAHQRAIPIAKSRPLPTASGPRAVPPHPDSKPAATSNPWKARIPLLSFLLLLAAINVFGFPYYRLSAAERVRSPLHAWLKPTGYVGQSMGIIAVTLFLALWLYPLRKKARWLKSSGSVSRWLDVHIQMGLCIPLVAAIHAAWQFSGLIGLGYGAMLIAWLSGILGKYLYARIPRSKSGLELTLEEVKSQRDSLLQEIAAATHFDPVQVQRMLALEPRPFHGLGPMRTLLRMLSDDIARWRAGRAFHRQYLASTPSAGSADRLAVRNALRLARRSMALSQQIRMLEASRKIFQYWHVAHRPMAISALVAILLHVITAVALGVTWFG